MKKLFTIAGLDMSDATTAKAQSSMDNNEIKQLLTKLDEFYRRYEDKCWYVYKPSGNPKWKGIIYEKLKNEERDEYLWSVFRRNINTYGKLLGLGKIFSGNKPYFNWQIDEAKLNAMKAKTKGNT